MAYRIDNKFPLDNHPRTAIGFSLPFKGSGVFTPTYTTKDQIKSNLINYFMTNKGERVFNPLFGGDIKKLLFEQITDENSEVLNKKIINDLKSYFPLVVVNKLSVDSDPDMHFINMILDYSVSNFGINDSINLNING